MLELAVPAVVPIGPETNLTDPVFANAVDRPDAIAFSVRRPSAPAGDGWAPVTARQFAEEVTAVAKGLIADGVAAGDRVALLSATRYEWTLLDYAIWAAGAVTVPIYETSSAEQVRWILADSEPVAVVVETPAHAATVQAADAASVRHVWQLDAGAVAELTAAGADQPDTAIDERRQRTGADSLATIIYTSGTTGRPKGCQLSHRNLAFEVANATPGLSTLFHPAARTLLFLPLAHVFARMIQCGAVATGTTLGHSADVASLLPDLAAFQPTFILSVPRVFEKVFNGAKQKAHDEGKGAIFDRAAQTAIAYSEALDAGRPGLALKARHTVFDKLVYARLRTALGGRCHAAVSGGAPLGARLGHFFRGIGVTVYEGYGLTETTAATTVNLVDALRIGTVGKPLPGVSVRIADDGEVLIRGDHVFTGYWRDPDATAAVCNPDGWFASGDLGELDRDGFLTITGRKKEMLVTANGKNVAPAVLEDRLRAHPLISQCMVVGDQQPFIACLVTIDADALPAWRAEHGRAADTGLEQLRTDPDLLATVQAAVDEANLAVSGAEAIKKFRILTSDFTEENGQLTPTLKLKRPVVLATHAADVEALYAR